MKEHFVLFAGGLKRWLLAQTCEALLVGVLWFAGLFLLHAPWPAVWAFVAGLCQFIPSIGPAIGAIGPVLSAGIRGDFDQLIYILILYAFIAVVDGLLIQPLLLKRAAGVPVWASILTPIVMGIVIPFWGILLAPPLLAIFYAYLNAKRLKAHDSQEI